MAVKQRKAPLRTCVACRSVRPKRELVRIVRTPGGDVRVDPGGKLDGRGASLCSAMDCFDRAEKTAALARSLQVGLDKDQMRRLREDFAALIDRDRKEIE